MDYKSRRQSVPLNQLCFDFSRVLVVVSDVEWIANHFRQMGQTLRIFCWMSPRPMHLGGRRKHDVPGLQLGAHPAVDRVDRQRSELRDRLLSRPLADLGFSRQLVGHAHRNHVAFDGGRPAHEGPTTREGAGADGSQIKIAQPGRAFPVAQSIKLIVVASSIPAVLASNSHVDEPISLG